MNIVNLMEHHVGEAYERLKGAMPGFVDTPEQRADVIVHALNRLPPKYVVTDAGKAVTEVSLDGDQQRATIEVRILDGMRMVALRPRVTS